MSKDPLERIPGGSTEQSPISRTREVIAADPEADKWNLRHAPCYRETMMYSIVAASLFGLTEAARKGGARRVGNTFVGSFAAVALGTWGLCRYQKRERHKAVVEALQQRTGMHAEGFEGSESA